MIKILFHIDSLFSGGAEKVMCDLVNNLNPNIFDITVQTLFPEKSDQFLSPHIRYRYIYPKNERFYYGLYRLEAALGLVYPLHMKDDYDIEVAYLECGPTKVIAASTNRKAKKIAWVHCDFAVAFGLDFVKKTRRYYQKFDRVVCVSEQCKKSFDHLFGEGFKTIVVHNVIDSEAIKARSIEALPCAAKKRKFTLCACGRFSPPKNYKRLLETVKQLRNNGFDFDLWILGDGEQRVMVEQIVANDQLEECVTLFGFQSNPYPFMREADLLVCSSNYEGFSTFITEGLILGKPIVTTECSGMRELLGDSDFGIVTKNDDRDFCLQLKKLLLANNQILLQLGEKSSERGKDFSMSKLVSENELFLKTVILDEDT